jgi:hypothetical protein
MALEEMSMDCTYINWTDEMVGIHLKFFYLETKKSKNSKFNSLTHYVKSADTGKVYGLSGNGQLNWFMNKSLEEAGRPRFYFEMVYKGKDDAKAEEFQGNAPYSYQFWRDLTRFDPAVGGETDSITYTNSPASGEAPAAGALAATPPAATPAKETPALAKPEPVQQAAPQQPAPPPAQQQPAPQAPAPQQPAAPQPAAAGRKVF